MSAKALATFKSLKRIEIIEIEPAMIQASKFFDRASVLRGQISRRGVLSVSVRPGMNTSIMPPTIVRRVGFGTMPKKSGSTIKAS